MCVISANVHAGPACKPPLLRSHPHPGYAQSWLPVLVLALQSAARVLKRPCPHGAAWVMQVLH